MPEGSYNAFEGIHAVRRRDNIGSLEGGITCSKSFSYPEI